MPANQDDSIIATVEDENLSGGKGGDTIAAMGGEGDDVVSGNSGDDILICNVNDNDGSSDVYDGGSGIDEIHLVMTRDRWLDPFTYQVIDADGDVDTAIVSATIAGAIDTPVIISNVGAAANEDDPNPQVVDLLPAGFIIDVDTSDTLNVVAGTLAQTSGPALASASLVDNILEFDPNDFDHAEV